MTDKLLEEIAELEQQASTLGEDKVALYDLLVQAYYKAKDLIVILQEQAPEPKVVVDEDHVNQLKFELDKTETQLILATTKLDEIATLIVTK